MAPPPLLTSQYRHVFVNMEKSSGSGFFSTISPVIVTLTFEHQNLITSLLSNVIVYFTAGITLEILYVFNINTNLLVLTNTN